MRAGSLVALSGNSDRLRLPQHGLTCYSFPEKQPFGSRADSSPTRLSLLPPSLLSPSLNPSSSPSSLPPSPLAFLRFCFLFALFLSLTGRMCRPAGSTTCLSCQAGAFSTATGFRLLCPWDRELGMGGGCNTPALSGQVRRMGSCGPSRRRPSPRRGQPTARARRPRIRPQRAGVRGTRPPNCGGRGIAGVAVGRQWSRQRHRSVIPAGNRRPVSGGAALRGGRTARPGPPGARSARAFRRPADGPAPFSEPGRSPVVTSRGRRAQGGGVADHGLPRRRSVIHYRRCHSSMSGGG